MGSVFFFCSACAQDHDIFKAPVYFENDGSCRLEGKKRAEQQIFDKACKGFRVESLPVEIC